MEIFNQTRFLHEFTMGMDTAGREYLSLVIKGTFDFPPDDRTEPPVSQEQWPLVMADEYSGEPGFSAPVWETDFAFRKSRCDVVLQGAAYAPRGKPVEGVRVGLKVGAWSKMIDVIGAREWRAIGPAITATRPHPFTRMVFSYDTAFGGTDRLDPGVENPHAYRPNPAGTGWATVANQSRLSGLPLPNTQMPGEEVTSPYGAYRPAGFGPMGRSWPDRLKYAGTYDQKWQDEVFPFLPADFDERYYQMAPEDQQIPFPAPGTPVILGNLTPNGREAFRLPAAADLPVKVFRRMGELALDATVRPDTLLFDPENRRFAMVWRVWAPLRRTLAEFTEAWIGPPTEAMLRAKREGRGYIRAVATGPRQEEGAA